MVSKTTTSLGYQSLQTLGLGRFKGGVAGFGLGLRVEYGSCSGLVEAREKGTWCNWGLLEGSSHRFISLPLRVSCTTLP